MCPNGVPVGIVKGATGNGAQTGPHFQRPENTGTTDRAEFVLNPATCSVRSELVCLDISIDYLHVFVIEVNADPKGRSCAQLARCAMTGHSSDGFVSGDVSDGTALATASYFHWSVLLPVFLVQLSWCDDSIENVIALSLSGLVLTLYHHYEMIRLRYRIRAGL